MKYSRSICAILLGIDSSLPQMVSCQRLRYYFHLKKDLDVFEILLFFFLFLFKKLCTFSCVRVYCDRAPLVRTRGREPGPFSPAGRQTSTTDTIAKEENDKPDKQAGQGPAPQAPYMQRKHSALCSQRERKYTLRSVFAIPLQSRVRLEP